MPKPTCAHPDGCQREAVARDLCKNHYNQAYQRGKFPKQIVLGVHHLSNVNLETKLGDCTVCGPQVPVKLRFRDRRGYTGHREVQCAERSNRKYSRLGITPKEYKQMYARQQGICPICLATHPRLAIDHDHETGEVRGLLCTNCNLAIGLIRDSADNARRAATYLEKSS